ncbi:hypothetical protein ERO13_D12G097100v2 [Gossypium hirsutum]|uniref:Hydrophobic seed protein domain-containing protein n=3 Tax=Gossypium TaxID=3633 RepID=A0A5J5NX18_GOSBA|nr:hypothetical protein ES319_D12G107800v1 [Gossypium barbadense]KAG4115330.1 hypothetical protein ERO13_D12G097100v2 [Gossypium hirsutum]TYH38511.1 hypothetical protein ES332_D12G114600v1 [Gossypium tomentosum]
MASKSIATLALLLSLNLLFSTMVTSTSVPCPPPPKTPKSSSRPSFNEVCANVLNDLVHLVIGTPPKTPCRTIIQGLVDLEVAVCLCTAIKANVLEINLKIPVSLSLLLKYYGKGVPQGFQCA